MARSFMRSEDLPKKKLPPGTLRRIARFAAPYKKILAIFVVVIIIDSLLGVLNPLIYRDIINRGILPKNAHVVVELAVLVAILAIFDALLSLGQRFISSTVGEGLIYDMRTRVFSHIQRMPIAFFTRTQTGALISRLNNDVQGAQQAFTNTLSSVVSNLLTVLLTVATMAFLSWPITLVALALLPVFLLPARRIGRRLAQLTRESYNLNATMNTTMTERFNVSGALLVKLFGRPQTEHDQFADKAGRVRDIGVQTAMYGRVFFVSLLLTSSLATALVYGWGGVLAVHGTFNVGTVVALTALLNRLYGPLTALSTMNVDIMTALVSFDRVFEVLDLPPMIDEKPDARAIPRGTVGIEFEHVDFAYPTAAQVSLASLESVAVLDQSPSQQVLRDVSFQIQPGQMVALVGPSGAGKTTISSLVPRLYDVDTGSIRVGGVDVRDATLESLRDTIGVVSQDSHLFHQTIKENLLFARPEATEEELRDALVAAQIAGLVDSLPDGLDTVVGDRGYRLSGGEKQRLALARLLLKAPDVVVLDEATAHLDSESEAAIQQALATALVGRTSIVIAHRLSTVRDADQILVVVGGRIVQRGRHEELLASGGVYADLYRTQFASQAEPATP
ncbi:MAG TPA: ABC transporter ATP-binding protein [Mycobacteriales bacterium]|nr:ABC transporter ATP-binding protein [Mycobacteriales bacterium]